MKKNLTELVFILGRSDFMAGMESDAIGGAIRNIGNIHKYVHREDIPAHAMFVITTDGQENASKQFTSREVKRMIERQKEKIRLGISAYRRKSCETA